MSYFDHNATTPLCAPAREAWLRVQQEHWHNASGLYREAAAARRELDRCRERLAELLGDCDPETIVFTSGATESCTAFFRACAHVQSGTSGGAVRTVISPYEHPAVREAAVQLAAAELLHPSQLEETWAEVMNETSTTMMAWMAASNETGEIFPWPQWLARGDGHGGGGGWSRFFGDVSQWLGKLPASIFTIGDQGGPWLAGCAHKFGGPKGVGFLRVGGGHGREGLEGLCVEPTTWQFGGPQERRWRAGTEDVAGVAAMVAALEWAGDQMPGEAGLRDEFEQALGWPVVGGGRERLWNTSMVVAPRHDNRLWLARLSQRGFQCSTGSACSSGGDGDSRGLAATGLEWAEMRRVLRFSSGWTTTADDWRGLREALVAVEKELDAR